MKRALPLARCRRRRVGPDLAVEAVAVERFGSRRSPRERFRFEEADRLAGQADWLPNSTPPGTRATPPAATGAARRRRVAADGLERAAAAVGDHGRARRQRLDRQDAEVLLAREQERASRPS